MILNSQLSLFMLITPPSLLALLLVKLLRIILPVSSPRSVTVLITPELECALLLLKVLSVILIELPYKDDSPVVLYSVVHKYTVNDID